MRFLLGFIFIVTITAKGQSLPERIVIVKNVFYNDFTGNDNFYSTNSYFIIRKGDDYFFNDKRVSKTKIQLLINESSKSERKTGLLSKFRIDTTQIKDNPLKLLKLYTQKDRIEWNDPQKELIIKKLTNINNYEKELDDYLSIGCCFTMHSNYRNEYIIRFYENGVISNELKSRRYSWGYKMPWTNSLNDTIYNYGIEKSLKAVLPDNEKIKKSPLKGNALLKYIVNKIIDYNMQSLYKLSSYSYQTEIDELKTDFDVISTEEVYGRGRYIWNEPKTMKVVLKNREMLNNVNLVFLVSKYNNTLYPRDSIKKDYLEYINRIQSIVFIADYLKRNPSSRLDIYYFNNRGINEYNIDGVNKNPIEWKKQDDYANLLRRIEKTSKDTSFDTNKAIKTSEHNYCGCNYRFDRSYIEKAIFFEINDSNKNSSIWFLLPDNKVLLYLMQGNKVLNYNYLDFGDSRGLQWPCKLFDDKGNMISK